MQIYASKEHIIAALQKGVRLDGRKPEEYRKITIETNVTATAEGSARVKFGDSEVIAGVKLSTGTPYPDTPDKGVLIVNAEMLPLSNPAFEPGPPSINAIETSRVIDRGIRESDTINVKDLCIREGELVWLVNVDICPINADGTMIDIGALAAIAALKGAKLPPLKDDKPDYKAEPTGDMLPVSSMPIPITVIKIGDVLVMDPTFEELSIADSRLTVTTLADGTICAMQKGGDGTLKIEDIEKMLELTTKKASELRKDLEKALK
ncbi:exosome complex protein Rrp42 [Candidatus Woesearchaeota archaeon]|nr:exosome complex protein Rrp42 [Candidatus Woesearchaeota archaeon]